VRHINIDKLTNDIVKSRKAIIICGPTCIGKSKIAISLAGIFKTDIISIDSMQVYRGMNIGTDKYDTKRYNIKQYMIDIFDPDHNATVAEFRNICRDIIENKFFLREKVPILVGGSGLYMRGVVDDLDFVPGKSKAIRSKIGDDVKKYGLLKYYEELKKIDPLYSSKISENDERRIVRALEVYKVTGKPFSFYQNKWESRQSIYDCIFIGIKTEKSKLHESIDKRVDEMFKNGLVEEVKALAGKGYGNCLSLRQAVGYKEVLEFLSGDIDFEQCVKKVKSNTKKLAKKQMTWFNSDDRIKWIRTDDDSSSSELIENILILIKDYGKNGKN